MADFLNILKCPACSGEMSPPISLCSTGHSLCHLCANNIVDDTCPVCREPMTSLRNPQLEAVIYQAMAMEAIKEGSSKAAPVKNATPNKSNGSTSNISENKVKITCPNKSVGCTYKVQAKFGLEFHLKECLFRDMECPYGAVFGNCCWNGKLRCLMGHFNQCHASNCNVSSGSEIHLDNVNLKSLQRYLYLVKHNELLYTISVKLEPPKGSFKGMAFWTIQHIGRKADAKQFIYDIEIVSRTDMRRKIAFTHHCFNDGIKADEIFSLAKCAVVPYFVLVHFIKDNKITFKFSIHKIPSTSDE